MEFASKSEERRHKLLASEREKKSKDHPNLSSDINAAIAKSAADGGIWLKDVKPDQTVEVQTVNTLYQIKHDPDQPGQWLIKGHARFCPEWTKVGIHGSTWGGSMLKMKFIGLMMHLEFSYVAKDVANATITTTPIQSIKVV